MNIWNIILFSIFLFIISYFLKSRNNKTFIENFFFSEEAVSSETPSVNLLSFNPTTILFARDFRPIPFLYELRSSCNNLFHSLGKAHLSKIF